MPGREDEMLLDFKEIMNKLRTPTRDEGILIKATPKERRKSTQPEKATEPKENEKPDETFALAARSETQKRHMTEIPQEVLSPQRPKKHAQFSLKLNEMELIAQDLVSKKSQAKYAAEEESPVIIKTKKFSQEELLEMLKKCRETLIKYQEHFNTHMVKFGQSMSEHTLSLYDQAVYGMKKFVALIDLISGNMVDASVAETH